MAAVAGRTTELLPDRPATKKPDAAAPGRYGSQLRGPCRRAGVRGKGQPGLPHGRPNAEGSQGTSAMSDRLAILLAANLSPTV